MTGGASQVLTEYPVNKKRHRVSNVNRLPVGRQVHLDSSHFSFQGRIEDFFAVASPPWLLAADVRNLALAAGAFWRG